jgi:hypothetical protein
MKTSQETDQLDTAPLDEDDEALLARLEKEGLVRRGQGGPIPAELLLPGPKCRRASVLDALIEERRSER